LHGASGYDVEITRAERHYTILVFDPKFSLKNEEQLVLAIVLVPGQVAFELCYLYVLVVDLGEDAGAIEDAKRELRKRERELLRVCIERAAKDYAAAAAQLAAHWQQLNAAQLALMERQLHWPQIYLPALRGMPRSWECHGRPTPFDGREG